MGQGVIVLLSVSLGNLEEEDLAKRLPWVVCVEGGRDYSNEDHY